mmetsp:Transcript_17837/g.42079  ORF Transcript_17837/g.42079 Transcript_17837/m.42079 type:complete len:309 (+) Transcript_17837:215-1141(+)|eukprot:CAMPEP_0168745512 /NCGR_PEP_ID=MMETSP0724-20121128/14656_1 /TAXON_ID=265536 /ORGANISM="Amphiprora sp., Strain CCMP467" /LENGTH=308 /DNA_ID=CAMNT_0008793227 /DNA_START=214 /DNA_END=1140 /DNA_ORIENTATION=+
MSALAKSQLAKAKEFESQAEKTLAKKSWFGGKEKNQEDAAETLQQAANAYKVGGMNDEAGKCYNRVGDLYRGLSQNTEAAKAYSQAGSCFKKTSSVDAVQSYQSAISLMMDNGRLTQAAKMSRECAELFENDDTGDFIDKAIEYYQQAADLFEMEDSKSQASTCKGKIAELASAAKDPPDLLTAGKIYNDLGINCLDSNLLKFNAKGYFLQAILCQLANGDVIGAQNALQRYEAVDYTFSESREGKFCSSLIKAVEEYDAEGFAQASFDYDRISKLDPWKTSMLVRIKRGIADSAGGGGGDSDEEDLT